MAIRLMLQGKSCPIPVVETRKALMDPSVEELVVIVDNPDAAANVERLAHSLSFAVEMSHAQGEQRVTIRRTPTSRAPDAAAGEQTPKPCPQDGSPAARPVLLIAAATIGSGSDELGAILMRAFIKTQLEIVPRPASMVFLNAGVELVCAGSPVLEDLQALNNQGVDLLACGTCLDFYQRKEQLRVGRVSNMFEIASLLAGPARVVRP